MVEQVLDFSLCKMVKWFWKDSFKGRQKAIPFCDLETFMKDN